MPLLIKNYLQENMFIKWRVAFSTNQFDKRIISQICSICVKFKVCQIIALGAGGGGIEPFLLNSLASVVSDMTIVLTDLVPHLGSWRKIREEFGPAIQFVDTPVDATRVPPELAGLRMCTGSIHHFPPNVVSGMLADAILARRPIIFIDGTPSFQHLLLMPVMSTLFSLSSTWYCLAYAVMSAPSLSAIGSQLWRLLPRLALTLSGVLPLIQGHDMLISALRFYGKDDFDSIVASAHNSRSFEWSYHEFKTLSVFVGVPRVLE